MFFAFPAPSSLNCVPVLAEDLLVDSSRLPPYRPSHLSRFHPYSRTTPSVFQRILVRVFSPPL
jgi:hypothetical protein